MDLFASPPQTLIEDADGGVRYWPAFAAPAEADAWFAALQRQAAWKSERRKMYDRVVDVPRLLAAYRTAALPDGLPLGEIFARVRAAVPAPYNAVGLNLYRDGADSVAMHNDKLHTIVPGHPITLLSLGDSRRMLIRAKGGDRRRIAVELAHGSLLSMSHASQLTHEHGIPKTARPVGARMSIVFRVRPEAHAASP
ncbi:alpha-ketoglutarate-dependent dioxygenase AlkB [Luteimonas sp. SJ-92]|uniref:Alpha-ketoglutarate-dependent dioxygenase AlkB n=1 Tax=Luteimonas salinisoli TaxID=2752307 RepID=A0A853JCU9_9GAMM|nr:alpha-ketoglutarate-dependent dioxygenase AlkB [Luteimonas salinisoli]NZA26418.1 alpha-ketoglutarate-dependent dioxygenase AlkB [Luteimonas salinisoli]